MAMKHKLTPQTVALIMRRSRGRCEWCQSRDGCGFDHIIPRRLGGTNRRANLQFLCHRCGQWKGGDHPERVIQRIKRLKVKGSCHWSKKVKDVGLRKMREFVAKMNQIAIDERATFENPLTISLGEGKVSCQMVKMADGVGIVFGLGVNGDVGSQGESIVGDTLRKNQVLLICKNERGAEVLAQLSMHVLGMFREAAESSIAEQIDGVLAGFQEVPEPIDFVPDGCCGCGKQLNSNGGCDDCIASAENEFHDRHDAETPQAMSVSRAQGCVEFRGDA